MSIATRLFVALFGLTALVLLGTLGVAHWSFERGFLDYMNALEEGRLTRLAEPLGAAYAEAGGQWTPDTTAVFEQQLEEWRPLRRGRPGGRDEARAGRPRGPRAGGPGAGSPRAGGPPEGPRGGGENAELPPRRGRAAPPTALYDTEGHYLAGAEGLAGPPPLAIVPIRVDGVVVGELRSQPPRVLESPTETAFSRQQRRASVITGFAALLAAALFAWALARWLLTPVRELARGVHALSEGNYAARLPAERKDELGALERDVNRLARTLEDARINRQNRLASISHELRTPLTVLVGEIAAIEDGIRPLDLAALASLSAEVQRLNRLIEDLYHASLSDIGGLQYALARVDAAAALTDVVEGTTQRIEPGTLSVDLQTDGPLWMQADAERLTQLFRNLLDNALAYTDAPGQVVVRADRRGDAIRVVFEDSAPSVSEADCERIFEPLFRCEMSRSRRTGGAGLGLSICENIVRSHDGSITAAPSELGGLRVTVILPVPSR